jgi:hypothetical protein
VLPMPQGRVAFWRYRHPSRGSAGYHLTADASGCEYLLDQLSRSDAVDLHLTPVTEEILSIPNSGYDAVPFVGLRIQIADNEESVTVEERHPRCTVTLSRKGVRELIAGVRDIAAGKGDYAIGPHGHEISFWWWPKSA